MHVGGLVIVTLMLLDEHPKKNLPIDILTHHLKAHRIRNNLISKLTAQRKGKKVIMLTNMCYNLSDILIDCQCLKVHLWTCSGFQSYMSLIAAA